MKKKFNVVCIIPARKGSKGIKLKNLEKIDNKPLIYYPITAAKKSKVIDDIFVSTDSSKIAHVSKRYGAQVPFLRKKKFAGDFVTTEDTLKNALVEFEKFKKKKYDICVFLTCTNLFRKNAWIKKAVNILKTKKNVDSVFSAHKIYKHFWHIQNGKLKKVCKWMNSYTSRQIAPKLFREDTGLACASRSFLWRSGKRIGKKVELIINEDSITGIDIHNKFDLEMARFVFKYLKKNRINYY